MLNKTPKVLLALFVLASVLLSISTVDTYGEKTTSQDLSGSNQMTRQMIDFISTLTIEEQNYLKSREAVTMCNNPNWTPIVFAKDGNQDDMRGIAMDTLKEITKKTGLKFKNIPTKSWKDAQQYLKDYKVDILPCYIKSPSRRKYANFTRPYLRLPLAIIAAKDKPIVSGLDEVMDKPWTRQKDSGLISKLQKEYPGMKIIPTKGDIESFQLVNSGNAYFTIATLPVASHVISQNMFNNLQIIGYTDFTYFLHIAVSDDDEILLSILDKALADIPEEKSKAIFRKWVHTSIKEPVASDKLLIQVFAGCLVVLISFIYRQYLLSKNINKLKTADKVLRESEEKYRGLVDDTPALICNFLPDGEITFVNNAYCTYFNKTHEELVGSIFLSLIPKADQKTVMDNIHSLTKDSPAQSHEHLVKAPNGEIRWHHWVNRGLFDAKGKVTSYQSIGNDITELKKAEDNYGRLFTEMLDGFALHEIICNPEGIPVDYRFLAVNPAFEQMTGLKAFDILHKTVLEVLPMTEAHWIETYGKVALSGEPIFFENYSISLDKHFEVKAFQPAPGQFACIFADITHQKQATQAIRENEERYRNLFEMDSDALALIDIETGSLQEVNQAFSTLYGYSKEECIQMKNTDFSHEPEETKKATLEQETRIPIRWHKKKDGTVFPTEITVNIFNHNGRDVHLASIRDITERKQAEEALSNKQRFLDSIIEQSPYPTWISDTQGTMIRSNPALKKVLNLSDEQLIGKYNVFSDKQLEPEILGKVRDAIENGKTSPFELDWIGEETQIDGIEQGNRVYCEGIVFPIYNQNGEITNAVITYKDISDKKRVEKELKAKEAQLQQSQKMETVGILAGGIAHEFNNLLYIVSGNAELLMDDLGLEDKDLVEEILKSTKRGSDLVKQLMAFSRKSETNLNKIDLNAEIKKIIKMLDRILPRMIDLKLELVDGQVPVRADQGQIEQVVLNLSLNSKDAMPDGGAITIKTENSIIDKSFIDRLSGKPTDLSEGKCVLLTVSDTGFGMDEETMSHIFDPFFTTKDIGAGTGLGLSVIYGIIEGHGGHILCESKPGGGTLFKIYFPGVEDNNNMAAFIEDTAGSLPKGTETILIVDDEESVVKMTGKILGRLGYKTMEALSGETALEIYADKQEEIDLIMLDLGMPGLGGKKCLEKLIELDPDVKVIIVSGYSDEGLIQDNINLGARGFAIKPFTRENVSKAVRDVLDA